ncbi:extracellular catalytic domain type 1 short-chain-length polyhydroxyalkanoate depolymerase [Hydrogenophaga sp. PBL-H3]|uniref:extracellular catalytic domain type 1 short-chain-length polyhydroxyalkanoate depolymerase n=1 Tax=Hydrogenophaga sp. PBL-H3 TaxID=434010 RepID=UPI001320200C|nr:PHB depolymerase family esterase [Hydrogenophaga sp. PBL-H3]QHE77706.1 prolyl oligopeptidase family serine peptidase [Hydrogenophaga sp. PBL-H3]QHE82130.1 prolyl oligopeptidase family serine peptidase [Hydrogenophaga sp. PBL-H3]
MGKRTAMSSWELVFKRNLATLTRNALRAQTRTANAVVKHAKANAKQPPPTPGDWLSGMAIGLGGARRYHLYRPPDLLAGERLPLLVMLHGCGQDAAGFASSTRMNAIARRERFLVLYPEQDRLASAQRCWNWFDTRNGRANAEVASVLAAIDQVGLLHPVDRTCVALAGMSAGASMAALIASRHPARFKAVVMHSGIAPGAAESTATALAAMRGHRLPAPLLTPPGQALPPLLVIQGGRDAVVAASNGAAAASAWALAGGAVGGTSRSQQRGQRHPAQVTDFKHRGRTAATLVHVAQLGHAWSGGAANQPFSDAQGPDASRMVWAFVSRHFAPVQAVGQPPERVVSAARPAFNLSWPFNAPALPPLKGATLHR